MRSTHRSCAAGGLLVVALLLAAPGCGSDVPEQPAMRPFPVEPEPVPVATARVVTAATHEATAPFAAPDDAVVRWLVPWDDGYLAVGVHLPPQRLPEGLPPEIAGLFPPEVVELFPDGLPASQQEAIDRLRDAGLWDAVIEVLNEHPEAMDAVLSEPPPEPETIARWTSDGEDWSPVEFELPPGAGELAHLDSSGDRVTIAATTTSGFGEASVVTIATTTDLDAWSTAQIAIGPTVEDGSPVWGVSLLSVAADDEHWVARVLTDHTHDAAAPRAPSVELWAGSWSGADAEVIVDAGSVGDLLATDAGFLDIGAGIAFSPDGRTWSPVDPPAPGLWFQAASPVGDRVIVLGDGPAGDTAVYVLDASGTTQTEVEIPGLDGGFRTLHSSPGAVFTIDVGVPAPASRTMVVDHDGYTLTSTDALVAHYQLVETATGDIVVEETHDRRVALGDLAGPFTYLTEDERGITVIDPESGEVVVQIPPRKVAAAWASAAHEGDTFAQNTTDSWLLATTDAVTWVLEDLEDADDGPGTWGLAATSGQTVLHGVIEFGMFGAPGPGDWQRFTTAG